MAGSIVKEYSTCKWKSQAVERKSDDEMKKFLRDQMLESPKYSYEKVELKQGN